MRDDDFHVSDIHEFLKLYLVRKTDQCTSSPSLVWVKTILKDLFLNKEKIGKNCLNVPVRFLLYVYLMRVSSYSMLLMHSYLQNSISLSLIGLSPSLDSAQLPSVLRTTPSPTGCLPQPLARIGAEDSFVLFSKWNHFLFSSAFSNKWMRHWPDKMSVLLQKKF